MLRRLALRDFAIVAQLELEFGPGFTVLTGETGAGKSILIDALQLALGARGDSASVREGATRADVAAEFDSPPALVDWLEEGGFEPAPTLLLRRTLDSQGKSRAWINGAVATLAQLREAADALVEIHGQHAWQALSRPAAVRALLDERAGVDTLQLSAAWADWRAARSTLEQAVAQAEHTGRERERLQWQVAELDRLGPSAEGWQTLNAEHQRLAHAQQLQDAAREAAEVLSEGEPSALGLLNRAHEALRDAGLIDPALQAVQQQLDEVRLQLQDAARSLAGYGDEAERDPQRLAQLDARLAEWMGAARRWRRPPAELAALLDEWRAQLAALDAAADLPALEAAVARAEALFLERARAARALRQAAAPRWAEAVTAGMQTLGMEGGRFEVALLPQAEPQAHGLENVELRVAGHAGATPRPLAKVASGGELSRLALAMAVAEHAAVAPAVATEASPGRGRRKTAAAAAPAEAVAAARATALGTLIFDEIDAGVGGRVADTVGALLARVGQHQQVLAVTHLAQVAARAQGHFVVRKAVLPDGRVASAIEAVNGPQRVEEIARMLGGDAGGIGATSRAHAQAMLEPRS